LCSLFSLQAAPAGFYQQIWKRYALNVVDYFGAHKLQRLSPQATGKIMFLSKSIQSSTCTKARVDECSERLTRA